MAKLIYAAFTSLDGYVADETGNFDWAELHEEVHAFINSRERQIGTYLFGRKMYETMAVWETPEVIPHRTAAVAAEKIVYSTTLQTVSTPRRGSSGNSRRTLYGNSRQQRPASLRWAIRRSQRMPFELALSTNITYSSRRSSRAAAIPICQARSP